TTLAVLLITAATLPAQGGRCPPPGFGAMSASAGSRTPVTGAPYAGVQTTLVQQPLTNGNQIVRQEQAKVYRDSQGRVRVEQTSTNAATGKTWTSVTITDPVAGVAYTLNSEAKTYSRTPVRVFARAGPPAGGAGSATRAGRGRA